mmetsp:Transcript_13575/g.34872  ORF Transcript_13575/g.34872 Transcript_13575/m.34872 type:complete len:227 (+) Transcript_13575:1429-2109(+)
MSLRCTKAAQCGGTEGDQSNGSPAEGTEGFCGSQAKQAGRIGRKHVEHLQPAAEGCPRRHCMARHEDGSHGWLAARADPEEWPVGDRPGEEERAAADEEWREHGRHIEHQLEHEYQRYLEHVGHQDIELGVAHVVARRLLQPVKGRLGTDDVHAHEEEGERKEATECHQWLHRPRLPAGDRRTRAQVAVDGVARRRERWWQRRWRRPRRRHVGRAVDSLANGGGTG